MGLIGLIVASRAQPVPRQRPAVAGSSRSSASVLFTALTAYDVQRIQNGDIAAATGSVEKGAVIGALRLYLDFINLFFFLLRLTGRAARRSASSRGLRIRPKGPGQAAGEGPVHSTAAGSPGPGCAG